MKVFISSACHNLIDVRAELADMLYGMGVDAMLSDDKLSSFEHDHSAVDRNSIQTCLVNVEKSDLVIVILDQRYGPSLGTYGFEDVSATHLEYRHAKKMGVPVRLYARDRLIADFQIHRDNQDKDVKLSWVKDPKNFGLFALLDEHKQLSNTNNWFDPFTSSVDLKKAVKRAVGPKLTPELLTQSIHENMFPVLNEEKTVIESGTDEMVTDDVSVRTILRNTSQGAAFHCEVTSETGYWALEVVYPGRTVEFSIALIKQSDFLFTKSFVVKYRSLLGVLVQEEYEASAVKFSDHSGHTRLLKRKYFLCDRPRIKIDELPPNSDDDHAGLLKVEPS